MKLYLVRHGRGAPDDSRGPGVEDDSSARRADDRRRLDPRGQHEAYALADRLATAPPTRILCAPDLRCRETMEPLAQRAGLEIETLPALAREGDPASVLRGLRDGRSRDRPPRDGDGPIAICTHAAVIHQILSLFEVGEPDGDGRVACKKGSVWIVDARRADAALATYLEPVRRGRPKGSLEYALREVAGPDTIRAAVLDMGSTSFTLQIADISAKGRLTPVLRDKEMLRLGAVIASSDHIPDEVCQKAEDVARALHALALQEKTRIFLPVATAAVRDAANGRELAQRISHAIAEPVRILSGQEEARIMFEAFRRRLDLGSKPILGVDLGGGSLELAVGHDREIDAEVTLRLGVVRLHSELVAGDPMTRAEAKAIRGRVRKAIAPHRKRLRTDSRHAIATGGTTRALAKLVLERRGDDDIDGMILSRRELEDLRDALVDSTHEERLAMPGMRRRRADLVPTGAVVLASLARELDLEGYQICDWGLREGVLFQAIARRRS